MKHISFYSRFIETVGYDPQCAILEIRLASDGKLRRYCNVPENIWYRLRESCRPDTFYHRYICGRFAETVVSDAVTGHDAP